MTDAELLRKVDVHGNCTCSGLQRVRVQGQMEAKVEQRLQLGGKSLVELCSTAARAVLWGTGAQLWQQMVVVGAAGRVVHRGRGDWGRR